MAQKKKRKLKKKYRVLRGIYAAIVAIAAVIVIGYGVYKVAVPAPAQAPVASTTDQTQEQVPGMETGDHTRREQSYTFLLPCPDLVLAHTVQGGISSPARTRSAAMPTPSCW